MYAGKGSGVRRTFVYILNSFGAGKRTAGWLFDEGVSLEEEEVEEDKEEGSARDSSM